MPIWTDAYLDRLWDEADGKILDRVECIFHRFSIAVTLNQSTYTLPDYVRRIIRVTWKGKKLDPLTRGEAANLYPTSAVVSETAKYEAPSSIPLFYAPVENNYRSIRFIPTPNVSLALNTGDLYGADISTGVIISCYRDIDPTSSTLILPQYIERRTKKAYVLSRAFLKEGKGQNVQAAEYFKQRIDFLLDMFKQINAGVYLAKRHILGQEYVPAQYRRPARPQLPPDYEGYNL